jgi:hypothetical protein
VRCRHTLVEQRTEWQQRMHAVLYHHGVPHARKLLTLANRERIAALKLPAAAREQLTIALEMIDAIEVPGRPGRPRAARLFAPAARLPRVDRGDLRGRTVDIGRDPCRARRYPPVFRTRATRSATPAWTSPSINPIPDAPQGISPGKDRPRCAGRSTKQRRPPGARAAPTGPTTTNSPHGSAGTARALPSPANCSNAATTSCATSATRPSSPSPPDRHAASPITDEPRPVPQALLPTPPGERPRKTERPHPHLPQHPSHHVPDRQPPRVEDRSKPGRPRTHPYPSTRSRTPNTRATPPRRPSTPLTTHSRHK